MQLIAVTEPWKKRLRSLAEIREDFLHQLFPATCIACEELRPGVKNHLCPQCLFAVTQVCPLPEKAPAPDLPGAIEKTRSIHHYGGQIQKMILAYKYGRKRKLAAPLAQCLYSVPYFSWVDIAAIIPVPMHAQRFKERGFDHVLLLALELKKAIRKNWGINLPVADRILTTTRSISHQAGSSRQGRLRNLRNAIQVRSTAPFAWQKRSIVLLDDVYTTGATASACCHALKAHFPALRVTVLTLART